MKLWKSKGMGEAMAMVFQGRRLALLAAVLLTGLATGGCGDDAPGEDAGPDGGMDGGEVDGGMTDAGGESCTTDEECDDDLFCTGTERCVEGSCVSRNAPVCDDGVACTADRCSEDLRECENIPPDEDEDGFPDMACVGRDGLPLGTDCDDNDNNRFPGNPEVCDTTNHDEDCDARTYGARDMDIDGHDDASCCNQAADGSLICGDDCNDMVGEINPSETEVCNGVDDDCDMMADEMLPTEMWSPDCDGDTFGDETVAAIERCAAPEMMACMDDPMRNWVPNSDDCADAVPGRNPGAPEVCNNIDDDCDGLVDDINEGVVACFSGQTRACVTTCGAVPGVATCNADCLGFGSCVAPAEVCNGCDDDANGTADDTFECARGSTSDCTVCGNPGTQVCRNDCSLAACTAAEQCNYCDESGDGGILDERFLASVDTADTPIVACNSANVTGQAFCGPAENPTSDQTIVFTTLLNGGSRTGEGAYWLDTGVQTGWGPIEVDATLEVRVLDGGEPDGGWSLVIADGIPTGGDLSTVRALEHRWFWTNRDPVNLPPNIPHSTSDASRFQAWPGGARGFNRDTSDGATLNTSNTFDSTDSGWIRQRVIIHYTPNDPATAPNEEIIRVTVDGRVFTFQVDGDNLTTDPSDDLPLHIPLFIGVTATSREETFRPGPTTVEYGARIEARLRMQVINVPCCSPEVTFDYFNFYSREEHCPGI